MMARQVARQFCRLGEVHSLVYGRRASGKNGGENGRKLTASIWGRLGELSNGLSGFNSFFSLTTIVDPNFRTIN